MAKRGRPATGQRHTKQATVRLDPPVMAQVDKYAEQEDITRARAIEIIVRLGLAQIYPSSQALVKALSSSLFAERVKQLPDLHPMVAEEVARKEVETLAKVIGGEIVDWGRKLQRDVEAAGKKMNDFKEIAMAKAFLTIHSDLEKEDEKQEQIKASENIAEIRPDVELLQKEREKQKPRKKTIERAKQQK